METTTIAITREVKEQIQEFGNKGESYSEILSKLIKSARERQLHDLLMDDTNCISIEEALRKARERYKS